MIDLEKKVNEVTRIRTRDFLPIVGLLGYEERVDVVKQFLEEEVDCAPLGEVNLDAIRLNLSLQKNRRTGYLVALNCIYGAAILVPLTIMAANIYYS